MIVYLVHEEWEQGGDGGHSIPVGVFLTQGEADKAAAASIAEAQSIGNQVYGHELEGQDECEWDVAIEIAKMELETGPADSLGPPVNWSDSVANMNDEEIRVLADDAANKAQHYARIAGYFETRRWTTHARSVKRSNSLVRAIRRALGFSYPSSNDINF